MSSATSSSGQGQRLAPGTVRSKVVFLKKQGVPRRVKAKVKYVASSATTVVTPRDSLDAHSTYLVKVRAVRDLAGHPWDQKPNKKGTQPLRYMFETA
jgi:hypothetical protein